MDDRIFFMFAIYMIISSVAVSFLPSSFYVGDNTDKTAELEDFTDTTDIDVVDGWSGGIGVAKKIFTYLFVTWEIDGIPSFFSLVLALINYASISIISLYIYDKFRGIGS